MILKDSALLIRTQVLAQEERRISAELIEHLREIERRKLYSDLGYGSLFLYCMKELHYSEGSAQRRVAAARLIQELPETQEKIRSGSLSLSVLSQARTFFRQESKAARPMPREKKREILRQLEGRSSREAERTLLGLSHDPSIHIQEKTRPVSPSRTEIRMVATDEQMALFEKVRGLLAHANPGLGWAELFEKLARMAEAKLDPAMKPRRGVSTTPQTTDTAPRTAPAAVEKEVWSRDEGRCQICGSRFALELDHQIPYALGGRTEAANLRLLCRYCNQRQAIRVFGVRKIERECGKA